MSNNMLFSPWVSTKDPAMYLRVRTHKHTNMKPLLILRGFYSSEVPQTITVYFIRI